MVGKLAYYNGRLNELVEIRNTEAKPYSEFVESAHGYLVNAKGWLLGDIVPVNRGDVRRLKREGKL